MKLMLALTALALMGSAVRAQDATLTLQSGKQGPRLSPLLHGIFFEEINHAGDGGLNPEKLRRTEGWTGWKGGKVTQAESGELTITGGAQTDGYWGIGIEKGKKYGLQGTLTSNGPVRAILVAPDGSELASATLKPGNVGVELKPRATEPKAKLVLKGAQFTFANASLMPRETWGKSGLRKDLATLVAGMKPSFVRFPGGCFVEGDKLANKFDWKTTLGPRGGRIPNQCLWGYKCTNGLGYHEYLQWCEDLKAAPLFVVNCGMSHTDFVPMDQMNTVVQSALDAIEYANGDPKTTKWGAERAKNGHPKPFNLRLIEIGNENGGPRYNERYKLIFDAIKKKYPYVTTIACDWGGTPTSAPVETIDEHYYNNPQFFQREATRYDSYSRSGPKIYIGEYAVTQGCGLGNLIAGLGEACFITGMERNSDVVHMASYAPLFVNTDNRAWNPDAIVFDSLRSYGTPSYWVQHMFSNNRGDVVLSSLLEAPKPTGPRLELTGGGAGVGTWRTDAEYADLRINGQPVPIHPASGQWEKTETGYRQTDTGEDRRAYAGTNSDPGDYTLTVRAKKRSGAEGFLVMFRVRNERDWYWWNIGGWGNTRHAIERSEGGAKTTITREVTGSVDTDRWYDIKIECQGDKVRC
ncbi:MAG: alpha-L-arabinofuranosidase C-terminal domain-containing protein [Armatimonas sp.]